MKYKMKNAFSMLEIVLAITIAGAGLTLILAVLPIALRASHESVDNNYLPMIASTFIANINATVDADTMKFNAGSGWVNDLQALEIAPNQSTGLYANDAPFIPDLKEFIQNGRNPNINGITYIGGATDVGGDSAAVKFDLEAMSLYSYGSNGFLAIVKSYDSQTGKFDKIDFSAAVKIEKQIARELKDDGDESEIVLFTDPITVRADNLPPGTSFKELAEPVRERFEANYVRLRLTVSWPLDASPEGRKSRVYIIDKAKTN